MSKKTRDKTIDIIKGIGILFMVVRHARAPHTGVVVLFHMALFFIASGFLYNSKRVVDFKSLLKYILRKIKSLWLPYAFFTSIFLFANNLFIKINVYTQDPQLLTLNSIEAQTLGKYLPFADTLKLVANVFIFRAFSSVGGALWFFQTLFFCVIFFAITDLLFKKVFKTKKLIFALHIFLALISASIGYYCCVHNIKVQGFARAFSAYTLVCLGYVIRETNVMNLIFKKPVVKYVMAVFALAILLYLDKFVDIAIDRNMVCNPVGFIAISFLGWAWVYSLALILQKIKLDIVNNVLCYISVHSVSIIALHFLAFKIVNAIGVYALGLDKCLIAAFPVTFRGGVWWLLYTFVGISVALILDMIFRKLKNNIINV